MVGKALVEVLQRGTGAGAFTGADARSGRAGHPVCGDLVELSVRLVGGRIAEVRWRASGCPAAMAVAALAAAALRDLEPAAAPAALRAAIAAHGGLARHEQHAEALALRALAAAVGS